jgi:hypothetical protein
MYAGRTTADMHLSDFMTLRNLSDEAVADAIGRNRVSGYRRRLVRPDWTVIAEIKAFTNGAVTAEDWTGPLNAESRAMAGAAE